MTWIKLDDGFASNPKIAMLSDGAFRLYITGLCYAGKHLTDGFIPAPLRRSLGTEMASKLASKLLEKGLWIKVEGGYQIHDYLKHQTSKAQAEMEKETNRLRAQKMRKAKSEALRNGVTNAVTNGERTSSDTHTPTPTDTDIKNSLSDLKIRHKEALDLCELLAEWIMKNGSKKPTITKKWIQDMQRIIDLDGRTPIQIRYIIEWSQKDAFWCANILSPASLREKFDQIRLKSPLSGFKEKPSTNPRVEVIEAPTPLPERFDRGEFQNLQAVPMPEHLRDELKKVGSR